MQKGEASFKRVGEEWLEIVIAGNKDSFWVAEVGGGQQMVMGGDQKEALGWVIVEAATGQTPAEKGLQGESGKSGGTLQVRATSGGKAAS